MRRINEIFESGEMFDGHYKLIGLLSTDGGSADVWLAIDINTIDDLTSEDQATKVVIKVYRPKNMIDIEGEYHFRNEFKKVFSCHHENIIQPTYFSIYEDMPYLVLPYCPSGSSELLVGSFKKKEDLWKYIYEVASGLAYLHEHNPKIIHQDIKPANVLIDDNGNYAITDFGISAEMGGADAYAEDETGGTFAYMAPERFIEGSTPMTESDIWAFGATLYELVTGNVPFGNDGGSKQSKKSVIPPIKIDIPEPIKQLIFSCLAYTPADRPTARNIVDLVLKRRYSKNKKTVVLIIVPLILMTLALILFFINKNHINSDEHFISLSSNADSIVNSQIRNIQDNNGIPIQENIMEFKKAIVLFNRVITDSPDDYSDKSEIKNKVETIQKVIHGIEEYDVTFNLVENARVTEMEDSVIKYSIVLENQKSNINILLKQLQ